MTRPGRWHRLKPEGQGAGSKAAVAVGGAGSAECHHEVVGLAAAFSVS